MPLATAELTFTCCEYGASCLTPATTRASTTCCHWSMRPTSAAAEILVKGGASPSVPVVQVDGGRFAASGCLEVRIEPDPRETSGNHLVVEG